FFLFLSLFIQKPPAFLTAGAGRGAMDQSERSALLAPGAPRAREQGRQGQAGGARASYSSIAGVESTSVPDPERASSDTGGFRAREYARLRRVVLLVTGLTTVLIGAGLLVGLLVPASITIPAGSDPDTGAPPTPGLVVLPVP
ncbi:Meiosis-specific protein ASY2, partial [Frankliniella fusca]